MRRTSLLGLSAGAVLSLLVVGACGGDDAPIIDAGLTDAPPVDGDVTDAPPAVVRVTITNFGAPVADVPVYFQNADDGVVASLTTTATGQAETVMAPGGFVTALINGGDEVRTFSGVKPGDELKLEIGRTLGGPQISFQLTFPAGAATNNYPIYTTCGVGNAFVQAAPGTPVTATMFLYECPPQIDFLVVSDDGDSPATALFVPSVAVADGQPVTLTGAYVATQALDTSYTGLINASTMELTRAVTTPRGLLWQVNQSVDVVNGTGSATIAVPVNAGVGAATGRVYGGLSNHVVVEAPAPGPYTLDTAGVFLPAFTDSPTYDIASATVSWSQDTVGATPDLAFASMQVFSATEKRGWRWQIVAAHAGASIALPTVPTDVIDVNPAGQDSVFVEGLLTAKGPGGYDALRPYALSVPSLEVLATANPGRIVIEELAPQFKRR